VNPSSTSFSATACLEKGFMMYSLAPARDRVGDLSGLGLVVTIMSLTASYLRWRADPSHELDPLDIREVPIDQGEVEIRTLPEDRDRIPHARGLLHSKPTSVRTPFRIVRIARESSSTSARILASLTPETAQPAWSSVSAMPASSRAAS